MKKKPMNNWKQRAGLASSRKTPLRDMLQPNVKYGLNKENKPLPSAKMLPPSRTPRGANFKSVTAHLPTPGKTGKYQFQLYWFTLWFLCGFQWCLAFASKPFRFLSIVCFKKNVCLLATEYSSLCVLILLVFFLSWNLQRKVPKLPQDWVLSTCPYVKYLCVNIQWKYRCLQWSQENRVSRV